MSGLVESRLAWLVRGDVDVDLHWSGRVLLPAVLLWGQVALVGLHHPASSGPCSTLPECETLLVRTAAESPGLLAGAVVVHALAVAVVYAAAVATTSVAASLVDLEGAAPALFAPDDAVLTALLAITVAWVVAYFAGAYGGAYTVAGAAVLYVLFFPLLTGLTVATFVFGLAGLFTGLETLVEPFGLAVGLLVVVAVLFALLALFVVEVLWLYALAHGAARAVRTGGTAG